MSPVALLTRVGPLLLMMIAAGFWISDVQQGGPYVLRNLVPPLLVLLLGVMTLLRGGGQWTGAGLKWPLATLGFAIPAVGLSAYLHYAYAVNLNDLFTDSERPGELFRFLPIYTGVAGGIGFAIGWIVGRNL